MSEAVTIAQLLETDAADAIAISAPERVPPLRHRDLRALAKRTVEALNALGIGRNDRVAIVLPNGPEMAASFVCIAAGATTAPLNPSYRAEEFEFYLSDLRARALVVEAGSDSPARGVAKKLAMPIIELKPERAKGAGSFTLEQIDPLPGGAAPGGLATA
jgi:oxalate---CoA ligase